MITRAICRVLVGREDELSRLEDALLQAVRGQGSVVVLAGDAGMGKTRLCSELRHRAERIGADILEGSCSEAELALPYLPFLEAIGNHLASGPISSLKERLGLHARELARVFPQLGEEAAASALADQPDSRLRLFEAILALLAIAAEDGGLLLIVEDLHWADASTRELLDYLTRRLRNTRILVLATYRRDEMHRRHPLLPTLQRWQRSRLAELVELEPLAAEGVARMISSIFDASEVGIEFRDFMHERSEGNPFVVEEMLKAAIDRGDIFRGDEDWERRPISELRIPETVRDTILLRVERLDEQEAEILRSASILGRSFDYQTLIALSAQARPAVENALQVAVQQQLLEEEPGGQGRYRFRHALTQEAIYEDLSAPARERLHGAAADVLAQRPVPAGAEVALHLRAANRWAEAVPATLAAAEEAERGFGYDEAVALYSVLLPAVPAGPERARLLCRLGHAYWLAGNPGRAVEPLEEGIRLLAKTGETAESAQARLTLGRCHWERGSTPKAHAEYTTAVETLKDLGPSADLAQGYIRLSGLRVFDQDGVGGRRLAEEAIRVADAAAAPEMRIWAQVFLGLSLSYLGEYGQGIRLVENSAKEAEEAGLQDIAGNALNNLIPLYLGNLQIDAMGRLRERLRAIRSERWSVLSGGLAGMIHSHVTGDLPAALEVAEDLIVRSEQLGYQFYVQGARLGKIHALIELGRADEARHLVQRPEGSKSGQDLAGDAWTWLRFHLAVDEIDTAAVAADVLLERPQLAWVNDEGLDGAIDVLVRQERPADARRLVEAALASPDPLAQLVGRVGAARIALAAGGPEIEREGLMEAITAFETAGLPARATRAGMLLARIDAHLGDEAAAEHRLRELFTRTRRSGHVNLNRLIGLTLAELGFAAGEAMPDGEAEPTSPSHERVPDQTGERLVTVMFADVRGYTAMTADTAPAEMVERIATYQRWAAQEVERHLGVVDKFAGDAVMATFNVSGSHVDHAEQALAAALALRDKAALLGLPIGIGIASGAAVVGRLKNGANLSVLGDTTNLAARLQAQARAGEVLLSEESHRRLREAPEAAEEEVSVKGFDAPVKVYRLGPRS